MSQFRRKIAEETNEKPSFVYQHVVQVLCRYVVPKLLSSRSQSTDEKDLT